MSSTAVSPIAAEVDQWLSKFDRALTEGDAVAGAELFGQPSYWRDLVAFTWNITTVEGPRASRGCSTRRWRRPGRAAGA